MMQKNRFVGTVLGKQGSGKTKLTETEIIPSAAPPVFILDTMDEYGEGGSYGICFYNMKSLKNQILTYNKNLTGIHILKADNDDDCLSFFELFTRVKQPATIIVEEASKFCNPYKIDENLSNILAYGRHWHQSILFIARQPVELHRSVTAQSDFIISFIQTESNDINKLKQSYDAAKYLPDLKEEKYEFIVMGKLPQSLIHIKGKPEYIDHDKKYVG